MNFGLSDLLLTLSLSDARMLLCDLRTGGAAWFAGCRRIMIHLPLAGRVTLHVSGGERIVAPGDMIMLARGMDHRMGSGAASSEPQEQVRLDGKDDRVRRMIFGEGDISAALILTAEVGMDRMDARAVGWGIPDIVHMRGLGLALPVFSGAATAAPDLVTLLERNGGRALAASLVNLVYVHGVSSAYGLEPDVDASNMQLRRRHLGVEAALRLIHRQPGAAWSVLSLARASAMSRSAFARTFLETTGMTPMAYVCGVRLDRARERLRDGAALTIGEVAAEFGYRSHGAFSRAYRQRFGMLPRAALAGRGICGAPAG